MVLWLLGKRESRSGPEKIPQLRRGQRDLELIPKLAVR